MDTLELIPTGVEPNVVFDKLASLNAIEIANLFRDEGIQGKKGNIGHCPIARYLQKTTGEMIMVGYDSWYFGANKTPLPKSCQNFVMDFDWGHYTDLILQ